YRRALSCQLLVQCVGEDIAPEGVKIFAARAGEGGTHFQAIRLNQVQGTQQTIKSRQHTQVLLCKLDVFFVEGLGRQAGINITLKCPERLLGVVLIKRRLPVLKALEVQQAEFVTDVHQVGNFGGR